MAVVPPRPSPPPPCQSLTRASSWTACAWQGRVICGLGFGLGLGRGRLERAGLGATELLGRVRACGRRGVLFRRTFRLIQELAHEPVPVAAVASKGLADKALLPPGLEVVIRGHGGLVVLGGGLHHVRK